ncbi:hypothetical protein AAC387_Pa02g2053 [Persea americana]
MAQFDHAGGSKRACRFAPSISPSRAFRRYIIMANRAGGSKVRASTRQACPQEPPFRKAQIVSSADIPRGQHCSAIHYIGPAAAGVRARGVGTMGMGRMGPKTVVLASRMAQFDHAGGSKRACLFAPSISPSRAFRRYIIMANRAGGSKVRASTRQACPQEPPFRKAQIVSSADIPRVRSYQR